MCFQEWVCRKQRIDVIETWKYPARQSTDSEKLFSSVSLKRFIEIVSPPKTTGKSLV